MSFEFVGMPGSEGADELAYVAAIAGLILAMLTLVRNGWGSPSGGADHVYVVVAGNLWFEP